MEIRVNKSDLRKIDRLFSKLEKVSERDADIIIEKTI